MSESKTISYNECRVIYVPGETNIVALLHPKEDISHYSGKSLESFQEEYPEAKVYTWDEVMPLLEQAQNAKFVGEFKEITEEQWWEMYECLPPYRTVQHDDGLFFGFLMSEYMTSNITGHYYRIQDRYFSAHRRDTDNPGDHYQEIMKQYFTKNQE